MIGIMTFSTGAEWVTGDNLVSPSNCSSLNLNAEGQTDMGVAFRKLNEKLSSKTGFLTRATGSVAPVLFLLSDGAPTDDYQSGLARLKNNAWYKVAARVAIGYGECNDAVLYEFTGNEETIMHTNNPQELKNMIKFVTITSSMVASGSSVASTGSGNDPDDNTAKVAEEMAAQGGELAAGDPNDGF